MPTALHPQTLLVFRFAELKPGGNLRSGVTAVKPHWEATMKKLTIAILAAFMSVAFAGAHAADGKKKDEVKKDEVKKDDTKKKKGKGKKDDKK